MLNIGMYKDKIVTTNDENLSNHHICVLGASGSGKTVQCQRLICSAVEQGASVIALDMHGVLADDQIFWKYKPTFDKYANNIDAHYGGIACDIFSPVTYTDGTKENIIDVIGAMTDMVADTIGAGSAQRSELRQAFQHVFDSGEYEKTGFRAVDAALQYAGNKTADILREKLYYLTAHNVFISGKDFYQKGKINIFRLSHFNLKTQQLIAEMILSYIWRLANAEQFTRQEIYVFVDECQNLPSAKNNALAQMLSEGRKFGVNLILATQMILQGTTSAVQQSITQCGLILYFRPAANRVNATARMIDPARERDWCSLLKTLGIGEFVADGSFMIGGKVRNDPLKISAYEMQNI